MVIYQASFQYPIKIDQNIILSFLLSILLNFSCSLLLHTYTVSSPMFLQFSSLCFMAIHVLTAYTYSHCFVGIYFHVCLSHRTVCTLMKGTVACLPLHLHHLAQNMI